MQDKVKKILNLELSIREYSVVKTRLDEFIAV